VTVDVTTPRPAVELDVGSVLAPSPPSTIVISAERVASPPLPVVVGSDVVLPEVAGAEVEGPEVFGAEVACPDVVGARVRPAVVGSEIAGDRDGDIVGDSLGVRVVGSPVGTPVKVLAGACVGWLIVLIICGGVGVLVGGLLEMLVGGCGMAGERLGQKPHAMGQN